LKTAPAPIAPDDRRAFLTEVVRGVSSMPPLVF